MIRYVQVRCPTPTVRGSCNRWQFELGSETPDGIFFRFRCAHCKEVSVVWSSQVTRELVRGLR